MIAAAIGKRVEQADIVRSRKVRFRTKLSARRCLAARRRAG